ncbi:hypothetical protein SAMN04488027_11189 [Psychroflexus sediminis]|uniref:Uncharacterized protein n=2 Tax=Psychroflexus sediminis TaxID=470826 RepID=A0A1G7YAZ2_9FLAO|nr:hypothetical protein SAMN04488027_11189 [Psychroflexus sediminis]
MIFLLLVFTFSNLTAQQELQAEQQLNNVNDAHRYEIKVRVNSEDAGFRLRNEHKKLFLRDPVKFCNENIDITGLIESIDSEDTDRFVVKLRSKKGYVKAIYNRKGELLGIFQKFEDRALPLDLSQKLFHDYNGWTITKTKYAANGTGSSVNKEKWQISLQKGDLIKIVKINPSKISKRLKSYEQELIGVSGYEPISDLRNR